MVSFVSVCQVARLEKEKMKRMTLDIHERQEEEDYQGTVVHTHTAHAQPFNSSFKRVLSRMDGRFSVKYYHPTS